MLLQGVYILLASVYTCVLLLLQLAIMTEYTLLITCCGCAWHHRISQLAAHDVIGWLMLLQISKSSESSFHHLLEPSRLVMSCHVTNMCPEIMWYIMWCVRWPIRWLTMWWSMWLCTWLSAHNLGAQKTKSKNSGLPWHHPLSRWLLFGDIANGLPGHWGEMDCIYFSWCSRMATIKVCQCFRSMVQVFEWFPCVIAFTISFPSY